MLHTNIFDSYEENVADSKVLELLAYNRTTRDDVEKDIRKRDV